VKDLRTIAAEQEELLGRMKKEAREALDSTGEKTATPSVDPRKMLYPPGITGFDEDIDGNST